MLAERDQSVAFQDLIPMQGEKDHLFPLAVHGDQPVTNFMYLLHKPPATAVQDILDNIFFLDYDPVLTVD